MKAPHRPRGEKPATTIRWQRRQMAQMAERIALLAGEKDRLEKDAAEYESQASELVIQLHMTQGAAERQRERFGDLNQQMRADQIRLAFLEGYYAKSIEPEKLAHDPAQTYRGSGSGNTGYLQDGTQTGEAIRQETGPGRPRAGTRVEIRGGEADDSPRQERRPLASFEVNEASDGIPDRGRYRRPSGSTFGSVS